jgi:hypothetical protein
MGSKYIDKDNVRLRKRTSFSPNKIKECDSSPSPRSQRLKKKYLQNDYSSPSDDSNARTIDNKAGKSKSVRSLKNTKKSSARFDSEDWVSNKILEAVLRKTEKSLQNCYEQYCLNERTMLVNRTDNENQENEINQQGCCSIRFNSKKERRLVITLDSFVSKEKSSSRILGLGYDAQESNNKNFGTTWSKEKGEFPIFLNNLIADVAHKIKLKNFVYYKDFVKALNEVVNQVFKKFPKLPYRSFFAEFEKTLIERQEQFRQKRQQDIEQMYYYLTDFKLPVDTYPRIPLQPRVYNEINDYKSVFTDSNDPTLEKNYSAQRLMKSDLKGGCGPDCSCNSKKHTLADYAEFVPTRSAWSCGCGDKRDNVECGPKCKCGPNCNNRLIQKKQGQILGKDVKIQRCWGIDVFSRNNIAQMLPISSSETLLKEELVNEVVRELNKFEDDGWEISLTFGSLYEKYKKKANEQKKICLGNKKSNFKNKADVDNSDFLLYKFQIRKQAFKVLFKQSQICQVRGLFRIYSKGLGVVCSKPGGIDRNSLIVEYFGEVYPTWYWYIKQDAIKSFLSMIRKDKGKKFAQYRQNYNMDFYNIMIEKSSKEPKGREIVVVDPIINGNFASRLSHCCSPNCCTLPVVSQGKYSIALTATKNIEEGEELTFDYCSFTESEKEFQTSVCLCGNSLCNGHYLSYTKKHVGLFEDKVKHHLLDNASFSFLNANAILLKSSISVFDERKRVKLLEYSIGDNTFKESPTWLKNWAFYVLESIVKERQALYETLLGSVVNYECANMLTYEMQNHKYEIENLFFQRINNLIITVDKAQHFLSKQDPEKQFPPPIRLMRPFELLPSIFESISNVVDDVFTSNLSRLIHPIRKALDDFKVILNESQRDCGQKVIPDLPTNIRSRRISRQISKSKTPHQSVLEILGTLLDVWNTEINMPSTEVLSESKFFDSLSFFSEEFHTPLLLLVVGKFIQLKLSQTIKDKFPKNSFDPLCDILYFNAMTVNNITSEPYNSFEVTIKIRECDLTNPRKTFEHNPHTLKEQITYLEKPIETITKYFYKASVQWIPMGTASLLVQADYRKT